MSNVDAPDVSSGEINNPDLLSQQSGTPNMSSTKTFTVDTNMRVNGDLDVTGIVTATSFIGDGSQLTGIVGGGVGLDSAGVTLLVDSDYVQARETPQDFAYSSLTGAPSALSSFTNDTNFVDSVGVISAVTSSDLDMGGNKVLFSNVYSTEADLPDATANHGMFAHVHATGAGYFAHAGSWVQLANDADIPVGGGGLEGFDVSQYDSATSNGIFEYNVSPGNQLRHLYSLNDAVSPTAYDGSLEHQVSWTISSNQQFGFRDAGGFRTKVNALANGSTATTGLVLEGETFNNSGVELVGNVKLSSLPTSDPSEIGLLWNDGGIPVFSGSTAPTGGGGLDSAAIGGVEFLPYKMRLITNEDRFSIGQNANVDNNGEGNIAIGFNASANGGQGAISLGKQSSAGGYQSLALGTEASANTDYSISVGVRAGANGGTKSGILIGYQCGLYMSNSPSEEGNVFIGRSAGSHSSLLQPANFFNRTVAIGEGAATLTTGETADAIAIGYRAGQQNMGSNSINIGRDAGKINAGDNSITVNATGLEVSRTDQYAIDIRTSAAGSLTYDTTNDWTFGAGVTMTDLVASGATVVFNNLPTVDPVNAGQLWNDAGTMKISAG